MWYSSIINVLQEGQSYRRSDLISLLKQEHGGLKENTYSWAIGNMLKDGILQRTGWGYYVLAKKEQKPPYVPPYSVEAQTIRFLVSNQFPQLGFTIFETTLLNEFLNHLIAKNTVYVQVERNFCDAVFKYLKWNTDRLVLYRPSAKQYSLYFRPNMIVVQDWISEAPLNPKAPHDITMEKMLVDIYCERDSTILYSTSEYPDIVWDVYDRYPVDTVRLLRYARRRHREVEIAAFIPEQYRLDKSSSRIQ